MGANSGCSGWYRTTVGLAFLILLTCCGQNGTKLKQGNLVYDAIEVFGKDSPAFRLAEAARHGDLKEIERLVHAGADVNSVGNHDISPLWWAAFAQNYTGFKKLLESGANPNAQRQAGLSVMFLISQGKDPRFLEVALQHGGNPNLKEPDSGETPLFQAVLYRNTKQIDLLIKAGADVNARSSISGRTLPMLAMSSANYELVYELLQHGADPAAKAKNGGTLADFIKLRSINADNDDPWRKKVLEFLAQKGINVYEK